MRIIKLHILSISDLSNFGGQMGRRPDWTASRWDGDQMGRRLHSDGCIQMSVPRWRRVNMAFSWGYDLRSWSKKKAYKILEIYTNKKKHVRIVSVHGHKNLRFLILKQWHYSQLLYGWIPPIYFLFYTALFYFLSWPWCGFQYKRIDRVVSSWNYL